MVPVLQAFTRFAPPGYSLSSQLQAEYGVDVDSIKESEPTPYNQVEMKAVVDLVLSFGDFNWAGL